jgi:hypothetical protein
MKMTLDSATFSNMVCDSFSRRAADALFDHLEETNPDWEFDEVELRSQFSEYGDACEAALDRGWESEEGEEDDEKEAMRFLERDCIVIEFRGGVIIGE